MKTHRQIIVEAKGILDRALFRRHISRATYWAALRRIFRDHGGRPGHLLVPGLGIVFVELGS